MCGLVLSAASASREFSHAQQPGARAQSGAAPHARTMALCADKGYSTIETPAAASSPAENKGVCKKRTQQRERNDGNNSSAEVHMAPESIAAVASAAAAAQMHARARASHLLGLPFQTR